MGERVVCVKVLSKQQKREIEQLLEHCESENGRRPDFFMEQEWNEMVECPCFFLLYQRGLLVCAVSAFLLDWEAELSAVTRLEYRGRGFFSKVMKEVFIVFAKYKIGTVIFRIESENRVARLILEHWGFQKVQTDYLMALLPEDASFWQIRSEAVDERKGESGEQRKGDKDRKGGNNEKVRCLASSEIVRMKQELSFVHASAFDCLAAESERIFESCFSEGMELWGYWIEAQIVGICFVLVTEQEYFLSAVSICKEEQRKGYGEDFLQRLLIDLWERERKAVFLQVSGENGAAVRLYRKLGFSIRQQLITYLIQN